MKAIETIINDIILLNIKMHIINTLGDGMSEVEMNRYIDQAYDDLYEDMYNKLDNQYNLEEADKLNDNDYNSLYNELIGLYNHINANISRKIEITRK